MRSRRYRAIGRCRRSSTTSSRRAATRRVRESDTGAMGGDVAHEFQVLIEAGEDRIVICPNCDYRANMEKATRYIEASAGDSRAVPGRSEIATPGTTSIEALQASLGQSKDAF